jgi:hypothetical protein
MNSLSSEGPIARRPKVFRALGAADPPLEAFINGEPCRLVSVLKHDSWAVTTVYETASAAWIVCKIGRSQALPLGVPGAWIGRWLAGREVRVFQLMQGHPGFPRWAGPFALGEAGWPQAATHHWIPGEPFRPTASVGDAFFPELRDMLAAFHARGLAYVDMSKWGNILIGHDGRPYLLDYQIHYQAGSSFLSRWLLRQLQAGDRFYLHRHWRRCRPDQLTPEDLKHGAKEPPHVWVAERVGFIFRGIRLAILKLHGVRGDPRKDDQTASGGS